MVLVVDAGRNGEVEEAAVAVAPGRLDRAEPLAERRVSGARGEVALDVTQPRGEPRPGLVVDLAGRARVVGVARRLVDQLPEGIVGHRVPRHPDQGEVLVQQPVAVQMKERRKELPLGEVAGGAEDHHGAGVAALERLRQRGGIAPGPSRAPRPATVMRASPRGRRTGSAARR